MEPWVFFDVGNLIWRAYHTTGRKGLSHGDVPTGVTYGFLREVKLQLDRHQTSNGVFCFDSKKPSVRKGQCPLYKAKRHAGLYTEEQEAEYKLVQRQVKLLKEDYLPSLGFKNLLEYDGFEADDCMGAGVLAVRHMSYAVGGNIESHLISSDKDLLQLLAYPGVTCWVPGVEGKATTMKGFIEQWGLNPAMWTAVKAIAGCSSDEIPGIPGVGEKTAALYLAGKLEGKPQPNGGVAFGAKAQLIREFVMSDRYKLNMDLVQLPHRMLRRQLPDDCSVLDTLQPPVTGRAWDKLFRRLGIRSIR